MVCDVTRTCMFHALPQRIDKYNKELFYWFRCVRWYGVAVQYSAQSTISKRNAGNVLLTVNNKCTHECNAAIFTGKWIQWYRFLKHLNIDFYYRRFGVLCFIGFSIFCSCMDRTTKACPLVKFHVQCSIHNCVNTKRTIFYFVRHCFIINIYSKSKM